MYHENKLYGQYLVFTERKFVQALTYLNQNVSLNILFHMDYLWIQAKTNGLHFYIKKCINYCIEKNYLSK